MVVPTPPDFPRGKVSGYMIGDLYYNLAGDPKHRYDAKGADQGQANIDGKKTIGRDLTGAQFRRVYFQLDNDLTARVTTRFRLEMDGKELTSGGKLGVFVKNAYLLVKSVIPRGDFLFGELTTPMFEGSEAFWQYRSVEKTVADFWGLRSSSDLGVPAARLGGLGPPPRLQPPCSATARARSPRPTASRRSTSACPCAGAGSGSSPTWTTRPCA